MNGTMSEHLPRTIGQARELNRAAGHHWFSKDTMRFFGSRVLEATYTVREDLDRALFVSSEWDGWDRERRAYTVRSVDRAGNVDTVGEFLGYKTRAAAVAALRRVTADDIG